MSQPRHNTSTTVTHTPGSIGSSQCPITVATADISAQYTGYSIAEASSMSVCPAGGQNQNAGSIHLLENSEILPLVGRWYAQRNVSKTRYVSTQLSGPAFLKDDPISTNGPAPIESSIAMSWSCRPNNPRFVWPCFSTVFLIISTSPSTILSGRSLYDGLLLLCTSKTGLHMLAVFGYTFESRSHSCCQEPYFGGLGIVKLRNSKTGTEDDADLSAVTTLV